MDPLVSIVVPVYNAERFISETIQKGVMEQSCSNWELLLVDDCSSDNSPYIMKEFSKRDSRISLITLKKKSGGPAKPRNVGISLARGVYIALLDADDIWDKKKLEIQVKYMEENINIGLSYTNYVTFFDDLCKTKPCGYRKFFEAVKEFNFQLMIDNPIATSSVIFRSEIKDKIDLFRDDIHGAEDWDYWIRLSKVFTFGYISKVLLYYREHPLGISKSSNQFIQELKVLKKNVLYSEDVPTGIKNKAKWALHRRKLMFHFRRREIIKMFIEYIKLYTIRPFDARNIILVLEKIVKKKLI